MSEVVDFHSHILPKMDDGSASISESVAMLRMEAEQGIHHVVATPHFYPQHDSPERFLARRQESEHLLRGALGEHASLPQISIGAEVYYFPGIGESEILSELTIAQKRCILLEMPQCVWTERMYHDIESIWVKQGITPVIAHIDRYIGPWRTYGIPKRLRELPVIVQANASFFCRAATRTMALRMLRNDEIHLLGSDCHNLTDRPPRLGDALKIIERNLGAETLNRIAESQQFVLYGN